MRATTSPILGVAEGQPECEPAAAADFRRRVNVAAVEARELSAQEQPKTHAARIGGEVADPAESPEQAVQVIAVDAGALVRDFERGSTVLRLQCARDGGCPPAST